MTVLTFPQAHVVPDCAPSRTTSWEQFLAGALISEWEPLSWTFTGDPDNVTTTVSVCLTPSCTSIVDASMQIRCSSCRRQIPTWPSVEEFDRTYVPQLKLQRMVRAHVFTLAGLRPRVRDEVLYALQQRDSEILGIRPSTVAKLVQRLDGVESVLDVPSTEGKGLTVALLRSVQLHVRRLRAAYSGRDGTEDDVWDCALVGLRARPNKPALATSGVIDFGVVRQPWLRHVVLETARATRPPVIDIRRMLQAAQIASLALASRPHGSDPTRLAMADMTVVFEHFLKAIDPKTQMVYSITHRRALLGWWRRLMKFGRSTGLMDSVSSTFVLGPEHSIPDEEGNEGELGRAIPEAWIAHLDLHLPLLGIVDYQRSEWTAEDYAHMYRTAYAIQRDTGRRTGEVGSLRRSCVEFDAGAPVLLYDNSKSRRRRRRLPIDPSTAELIAEWKQRLETLPVPKACRDYLFPAPGARNRERRGHLSPDQFGKRFRAWADAIPAPTNLPPEAEAFKAADIEPYGLRHAYAQRHADNGTPVDVLKELMDHNDINTTMGYYTVSQ